MSKRILIAVCISWAMVALACSTSEPTNSGTNSASTQPAATATPASTKSASSSDSTGDKIGVAECDDYIAKYDACVSSKVPEVARAQYKTSLEQLRRSWKTLSGNPQTKASLAEACKTATEQARTSMKTFNCSF